MVAAVVFLIVFTLAFLPIRIRICGSIVPKLLQVGVCAKLFGLSVFAEKITAKIGKLVCVGTIDVEFSFADFDPSAGIALYKCVTLDELRLCACVNYATVSPVVMVSALSFLRTAIAVFSHFAALGVSFKESQSQGNNYLVFDLLMRLSVGELLICLIKEGIKKWLQTRK